MFQRVAIALALAAAGCSGPGELIYSASEPVNPDPATGRSTPLTVRVLLLRDDGRFLQESYDNLWERPQEVLADALAGRLEFVARIGRQEAFPLGELKPEVRFVGLVAGYPNAAEGQKRHVCVPIDRARDCIFEFTGHTIAVRAR